MVFTNYDLKYRDETIANENYLWTKKDIVIDLDKWESGESNVLLITGLSRSGKSTLANEMTTKYKNVHNIELDRIENTWRWVDAAQSIKKFDPILVKFFDSTPIGQYAYSQAMKKKNLSEDDDELHRLMNEAIQWILNYTKTLKSSEKVVIEGVQIFYDLDIKVALNYPIIIKGTSMVKSFIRRSTHGYRTLRNYITSEKQLQEFRKKIIDPC